MYALRVKSSHVGMLFECMRDSETLAAIVDCEPRDAGLGCFVLTKMDGGSCLKENAPVKGRELKHY